MAAYVIVDLEIVDPATFQKYRERVVDLVKKYGGKYLAASDVIETLEGDWKPNRIVIIEFPSAQRASAWIKSDEYRAIAPFRHRAAKTNMILAEGV